MKIEAWIQKADSASINLEVDNAETAIKAYHAFDWVKETERAQKINANTSVPPNFGLKNPKNNTYIMIAPGRGGIAEVFYDRTTIVSHKFLGLIPTQSKVVESFTGEGLLHTQIEEIIKAFFLNDETVLLKYCKQDLS